MHILKKKLKWQNNILFYRDKQNALKWRIRIEALTLHWTLSLFLITSFV
jgi:hypothetical protein